MQQAPKLAENPLELSWHDSALVPFLNPSNVIDYFSDRTNPFYDRTCNNEVIKMQRLGADQLNTMTGLEYILLHVQQPILYVIRKQHRHSPTQCTPLADYYILAGVIYQAPDLNSVINSRMLTTIHHLQTAFEEAISYSKYHPSKGYWWEFKDHESSDKPKSKDKNKEEPSSMFQRRRVDVLLSELSKKFPPKLPSPPQLEKQTTEEASKVVEVKQEKPDPQTASQQQSQKTGMKPPPEKRPRLMA